MRHFAAFIDPGAKDWRLFFVPKPQPSESRPVTKPKPPTNDLSPQPLKALPDDPSQVATFREAYDPDNGDEDFVDPLPPPIELRPRGKPRRGLEPARIRSVRIDDAASSVLESQFGSLGNALYHIYRGVMEFRARAEAKHPKAKTTAPRPRALAEPPPDPYRVNDEDLALIRSVLNDRIDRHRGPDKEIAPLIKALRKLEHTLMRRKPGSPF